MKFRVISLVALACCAPTAAYAHASFAEKTAEAGRAFKAALVVPHGCDGAATNEVRIVLPEGFIGAQPMPKPGWQVEIRTEPYGSTYRLHGREVTEGPVEIRWSGGSLDDAHFDEFIVRGTFDASLAGTEVAFPATQLCEGGDSVAWDEIAAPGEDPHALDHPAPLIRVTGGGESTGHAGHAMHGAAQAEEGIVVEGGFARAMLPNAPSGGGYLTIRNAGAEDDRLTGLSSPAAGTVELHEMAMENDVMRMRALPEGIAVPAGESVQLEPGGLHLMFLDVSEPFVEGGKVPVTLSFEKAGEVEAVLEVGPPNAQAAGGAEDSHAHH